MTSSKDRPRSKSRRKMIPFRCSEDDHALLLRLAAAEGVSAQVFMERRVFNRPAPTQGGAVPQAQKLPMAG